MNSKKDIATRFLNLFFLIFLAFLTTYDSIVKLFRIYNGESFVSDIGYWNFCTLLGVILFLTFILPMLIKPKLSEGVPKLLIIEIMLAIIINVIALIFYKLNINKFSVYLFTFCILLLVLWYSVFRFSGEVINPKRDR